jgi:hypothetical protein
VANSFKKSIQKNQKEYYAKNPKPKAKKKTENLDWKYFYGRSYVLPVLFIAISIFSAFSFSNQVNNFYYFTVAAYFGLGIYYFVKKPYLRVGKDFISTRRLGYDKSFEADQIKTIELYDGYVLISFKKRRTKWVFAKSINRYPVEDMAIELIKFASLNKVELINETKGNI